MGFVKLDCGIVDSSLWIERDTRSVFLTALVMAEPFEVTEPMDQIEVQTLQLTGWQVPPGWYGIVRAAGNGIIRRDGCDDATGFAALEELGAPDQHSRSQEYDGRRLVRVNGGYIVLNYFKYRDRDYTAAERMRRLRARKKQAVTDVTRNPVDVTPNVTQAEAELQSTEVISSSSPEGRLANALPTAHDRLALATVLHAVPNIEAWTAELSAALDGMHGPQLSPAQLGEALRDYVANGLPETPTLRHFRAYMKSAAAPKAVTNLRPREKSQSEQLADLVREHKEQSNA
jgi:hypothetical protein